MNPKLAASLARALRRTSSKGVARIRDIELNALTLTFARLSHAEPAVAIVGWADPEGNERVEKVCINADSVVTCVVRAEERPARTAFEVRRGPNREPHRRFDALLP